MSRLAFSTLRARLRATVRGHDAVVDHLAFVLSAEAGAGVPVRTLLLGETGAGVEHLIEVLTRSVGLPALAYDLDTPDYDSDGNEEAGIHQAVLRLLAVFKESATSPCDSGLLVLRGFVSAAHSDRRDFRGSAAGGPRLGAASRVLRGNVGWYSSRDDYAVRARQLAIIAIDEVARVPGTHQAMRASNALHAESLHALGVPDTFLAAFPRRYRLGARGTYDLEAILCEADDVLALLDAAWSLGAEVTISTEAARYLAAACARGQLTLTRAIDLVCEQIEIAALRDGRRDELGPTGRASLITPDDLVPRVRSGG